MEQLSVDIHSADEARLIKDLLKRFKSAEVMSFTPVLSQSGMSRRISQGLKDADEGRVKPWRDVKRRLVKKIAAKSK